MDAQDEPVFEIPDETATLSTVDQTVQQRTDIKLANLQVFAAQRIVSDSWKDWLPSVTGLFQPLFQDPGSVVSPRTSWRAVLSFGVPVFDAGTRRGAKEIRQASLQQSQAVAERTGPRGEIRGAPRLRVGAPQRACAPELACRVAAGLAGARHHHVQLPRGRGDEPRRHRRAAPLARRGYRGRGCRGRRAPVAPGLADCAGQVPSNPPRDWSLATESRSHGDFRESDVSP